MHNIWLILKSEFWRRVRTKSFILSTLLAPLFILAIAVLPAVLGYMAASGDDDQAVAVLDETGVLYDRLTQDPGGFELTAYEQPLDSARAAVRAGGFDAYLFLPADLLDGEGEAVYGSVSGAGLSAGNQLSSRVREAARAERLARQQASPEVLAVLEQPTGFRSVQLTDEGEAADGSLFSAAFGYLMGFLIYIAMFVYGAYVQQGVLEEKTNRVVEVMVSSVRPFQLLMGKVLGIGAMGLVQMTFWGGLLLGMSLFGGALAAQFIDPADFELPEGASQEQLLQAADIAVPEISVGVFVLFLLFFLGGYLLYASLFAAAGSAVEQQQDAQTLMFPIMMLIVIPILFIAPIMESPNGALATWMSMVPFFSPILMVVRTAVAEVPLWQPVVALLLLTGTFLLCVWLAARIYRVGILMYGKKASFRDLARWVRQA